MIRLRMEGKWLIFLAYELIFLKYSPFSDNIFIDMVIPSVHDKTIAPEGKHII